MFDADGFNDAFIHRITNAAVAGGTIGGAFAGAAGIHDAGKWADVAHGYKPADLGRVDELAKLDENDPVNSLSNEQYLQKMQKEQRDIDPASDFALRKAAYMNEQGRRSTGQKAVDTVTAASRLFGRQLGQRFNKGSLAKSPAYRRLASLVDASRNKIHSGKSYETSLAITKAKYMNMLGENPKQIARGYRGHTNIRTSNKAFKESFNKIKDDYLQWYENNHDIATGKVTSNYDWNKWGQEDAQKFSTLFNNLDNMAISMRTNGNNAWVAGGNAKGLKFNRLNNYLLKFKAMKKGVIEKNRSDFQGKLMSEYGFSSKVATELTTKILEGDPVDGIDNNIFNLLMKGVPANNAKARTLGLSQNPAFDQFFHDDLIHNLNEATRTASRFETYHKYVGKDNWRLNKLLHEASDQGVSKEELNAMASHLQDYFDSQSGNYKRPAKGSTGERLMVAQKFALTWSLLTSLGLSAFSSMAELALSFQGLTNEQIFSKDKNRGINGMGFELANMLWRGMYRVSGIEAASGFEFENHSEGMNILRRVGMLDQEMGAATTVGATETLEGEWTKNIIEKYFKYNGLQGLTNTNRSIRAANGMDAFIQYGKEMMDYPESSTGHRLAKQKLRDLGINPEFFNDINERRRIGDIITPAEEARYNDMIDAGLYEWINQAVALPGAANRPLFYQDPRFALLTQFNGFIAVFTANHIPRMWNDYIRKGPPSVKFNTFAMMATMILLGFVSQYLKDLIKHGQATPYLDDQGKLRRAVNASGLLGSGERALNLLFPMYDQKHSGPIDYAFDTALGEVPAAGPIQRLYKGVGNALEGDASEASYNFLRAMPFMGPLTGISKLISGKEGA